MDKLRIWLFEDSVADAIILRLSLDAHFAAYEVTQIDDGDAAAVVIQECAEGKAPCPDLFIIDLNLPKRNGMELLQRIKESPGLRQIPAVILSSSSSPKDQNQAIELGAVEFIQKPNDLTAFLEVGSRLKRYVPLPSTTGQSK